MIVALDGSGDFTSVQQAIDQIPEENKERVIIQIKNGVYKEKLHIIKPFVTLVGEDTEKTILTFDDAANKIHEDGEKMGTFRSYSVFVGADDFTAENITFENSAGDGREVGQALATYIDGDRMIFKNCKFLGHQDTIFTGPLPPKPRIPNSFKGPKDGEDRKYGRHYYENCTIVGDVDFIFGSSTAVFNKCEIVSLDRNSETNGYITAASTAEHLKNGYVFFDCKLASDAAAGTVYLGRPWREFARTGFINCWMGAHIKSEGWHNWGKEANEKTVTYYEYNSMGPGAKMDQRIPWAKILTAQEAKEYTIESILAGDDGWNPTR